MMGDLVVEGTATSGSGTTLVDTNNLLFANNDDIKGHWVGIDAGAAIGDERPITSFTASSDTITVTDGFSATIGTSSTYIVTHRWRPQLYLDAVAAAVRRSQHFLLLPLDDISGYLHELITLGDILSTDGNANGQMEAFTSGVPTGWAADGNTTSASDADANDVRRGGFSYKMTSDGSNLAQLRLAVKYFSRYAGTLVTLKALVRPDTDARALIRVDDGPSTAVTDTGGDGANVWEALEAALTLAAASTELSVDCEISAGGAVNANFDDVRLIWEGGTIYEYDLPSRLVYLSKVEVEIGSNIAGTTRPNAWAEVPRDTWKVQRGANPKLVFIPERYTPGRDVHIRLTGQAYPATLTTATPATMWTETIQAPAEFIKSYVKWYLLNSLSTIDTNETDRRERSDAQRAWMEMEATFATINSVAPGSELVRVG